MKKTVTKTKLKLRREKIMPLDINQLTKVVGGSGLPECQLQTRVGGICNQ